MGGPRASFKASADGQGLGNAQGQGPGGPRASFKASADGQGPGHAQGQGPGHAQGHGLGGSFKGVSSTLRGGESDGNWKDYEKVDIMKT